MHSHIGIGLLCANSIYFWPLFDMSDQCIATLEMGNCVCISYILMASV